MGSGMGSTVLANAMSHRRPHNAATPHAIPPTMTPDSPTTLLFISTPRKNPMYHSDSHPHSPMNNTPTSTAKSADGDADTGTPLPPILRQWKSDILRGAAAADEASQRLFDWLNDRGQAEGELTRTDLLAVDADELEMFLDDLRDLQEQAEYAVEAMEAVMAAVDEGDENDDEN